LQKDFWPRSEEHFSRIRRAKKILIQKFSPSVSIVAGFCPSGTSAATFATVSAQSGRPDPLSQCPLSGKADIRSSLASQADCVCAKTKKN
jgi:hypothetical protein